MLYTRWFDQHEHGARRYSFERSTLIQADVIGAPVVWSATDEANNFNRHRIVAYHWHQDLPLDEHLAKANAAAAWPQLESGPIFINK